MRGAFLLRHTGALSEVLGREHAFGAAQDGVLGCIIRMFFGRDLQHRWNGLHVGIDGVTDHLCDELVDQDNPNVVTCQEAPGWTRTQKQLIQYADFYI